VGVDEVADALHLNERTILRWEAGREIPKAHLLPAICDALGVTPDDILSASGPDPAELAIRDRVARIVAADGPHAGCIVFDLTMPSFLELVRNGNGSLPLSASAINRLSSAYGIPNGTIRTGVLPDPNRSPRMAYRTARLMGGFSAEAMAERLGVAADTIRAIEVSDLFAERLFREIGIRPDGTRMPIELYPETGF
jgi:transcriptional regulator with XRE-family HTH domain